ncbi:MAG: ribulose-phosphate 3-epimerase [Anaerolineales bacterium]|jgi:ribulose-phosphate 3-epimerase
MEGYLLAPSILSADFACLQEAIEKAEAGGADWIHVDVMDGHFVPNLTMGPFIVEACRRLTKLPLDVHLMVEAPEKMLRPFAEAGADSLTVHVEACTNLHRTIETIHALGVRAGVVLNPGTPAIMVSEVLPWVDLVLILTVEPGYSGQPLIPGMLDKVSTIRAWRDERNLSAKIEVDGGITAETAPAAAKAGAEIFVAASAVFKHPGGIEAGLQALRKALSSV